MILIGSNYDKSSGVYSFFFRLKNGFKDYMSVYDGYKVRDMFMFSPDMTLEEYQALPEKI